MEGTADQRRLEVEKIMYEYKWLCKKMNCSAILISQLNREIERRDEPVPQMSDFAESGAIEQTAEMAAFVYYPYNTDPEVYDKYESRIIVANQGMVILVDIQLDMMVIYVSSLILLKKHLKEVSAGKLPCTLL